MDSDKKNKGKNIKTQKHKTGVVYKNYTVMALIVFMIILIYAITIVKLSK